MGQQLVYVKGQTSCGRKNYFVSNNTTSFVSKSNKRETYVQK